VVDELQAEVRCEFTFCGNTQWVAWENRNEVYNGKVLRHSSISCDACHSKTFWTGRQRGEVPVGRKG